MTKHRSHAIKTHHATSHSEQESGTAQVVPLHAAPTEAMEQEPAPPFLGWPSYLFEMMMAPWQHFMPFTFLRPSGQPASPKADHIENDKEYIYRVELPGVLRDQVALNFQNGMIMLRVEESEDQRKKGYHYMHARSLRRAFSLPVYTDAEAITAELKDGVLTIIIPKTDKPSSPKSRLIDIA